jgi:two-component sensor histidine kinase
MRTYPTTGQLGIVILCVGAATIARFLIGLLWPDLVPFVTYFPAVLFAAFVCGVPCGAATTALGAIASWWLFLVPHHRFFPIAPDKLGDLLSFILSCTLIIWAVERYRSLVSQLQSEKTEREKVNQQLLQQQDQLQTVLHEVSHRAKNLVAVVSAIANQTVKRAGSFEEFQTDFTGRLQALAKSYDALVERNWSGMPIQELVRAQLAPFHEIDEIRIRLRGPDLTVNSKAAEQLGLCLHELATNAVKYGALSVPSGTVDIEWRVEPDENRGEQFCLTWRERSGPPVTESTRFGFGSLVLQRLAPGTLRGKASKDFAQVGITWKFRCPLNEIAI